MSEDEIRSLEEAHEMIQETCKQSMLLGLLAAKSVTEIAPLIDKFKGKMDQKQFENAVDSTFSEDFASWIPEYQKIAALEYATDDIRKSKASVIQKAFKLLDIYPSIIQEEKKTDGISKED